MGCGQFSAEAFSFGLKSFSRDPFRQVSVVPGPHDLEESGYSLFRGRTSSAPCRDTQLGQVARSLIIELKSRVIPSGGSDAFRRLRMRLLAPAESWQVPGLLISLVVLVPVVVSPSGPYKCSRCRIFGGFFFRPSRDGRSGLGSRQSHGRCRYKLAGGTRGRLLPSQWLLLPTVFRMICGGAIKS